MDQAPKLESRSMNEDETKAFLLRRGAKPLSISDWEPGQPIVFVMNDFFRNTHYSSFSKDKKPSLAHIVKPDKLSPVKGEYRMQNGGRIDYYAVDTVTGQLTLVKSSANTKGYVLDVDKTFTSS